MSTNALQGFPPIADPRSRILILGSMPGTESLRKGEYYGHPHNAFWKILEKLYGRKLIGYEAKVKLLLEKRLALWDVLASCYRNGSGDTQIVRPVANDLRGFLALHAGIKKVLLNGGFALKHYQQCCGDRTMRYVRMPSTSPANASLGFEEKFKAWARELKSPIGK